ncbi:winged helix-turn-helix domain-containing protein [Corynebacterium argentoratense]
MRCGRKLQPGNPNYLRVYLFQLRQKLEADPKNPRHFITLPSVGYRFEQ